MQVRLLFMVAIIAIALGTQAQNTFPSTGSVGIGTTSPKTSSLLEVNSTTKGVLVPRMTATQRTAISTPAQGLLVFQTDGTTGFYYYNSGWKVVTPATSGFANTKLSNLSTPTAINQTLLPSTTNARDLGSSTLAFRNLYLRGDVYLDGTRFVSNAPGTGQHNAFLGSNTGVSLTSGIDNTALGHYALNKTTTGYANTVSGAYALYTNTTGRSNTAVGTRALYLNTSGYYNTAVGDSALYSNTTSSQNTATGAFALNANTTGVNNTANGTFALFKNTTSENNTGIGAAALYTNTTGYQNTALGTGALQRNISGVNNTAIGAFSLNNNQFGSQNTALGYGAEVSQDGLTNATAIGAFARAMAPNQVMLGSTSVTSVWAAGGYIIFSDGRFKSDVKADVPGLEFINSLKPVTYHYKIHEMNAYINPAKKESENQIGVAEKVAASDPAMEAAITAKEHKLYTGFVAQDVEKAAKNLNYDFSGVYKPQNDKDVYGLSYADFVVPLVKAVQQLDSVNKVKDQRILNLETRLAKLEDVVNKLNGSNNNTLTSTSTLNQNIPNPVVNSTKILYSLAPGAHAAQLLITDATGKTVKAISLSASGSVDVNAATWSSGVYNYTLIVDGNTVETKKMIVAR